MPRKPNWKSIVIDRLLIIPKKYPHNILGTCVIKDRKSFYMREMKIFGTLFKKYPNQDFWHKARFSQRYECLSYFKSKYGKTFLKNKYNEFIYVVPKNEVEYKVGEKHGVDKEISVKPKTIKDFLNI
jgi:hypothetical protein